MISEAFGQLGKLFFSQCSHFKFGWPAKHLCSLLSRWEDQERGTYCWLGWHFQCDLGMGKSGRQAFFVGWLVAPHFALGLEIKKSVTSSVWPLGTLQNLRSLGVAVKKCPVSYGCTVLMGRTQLWASALCFFIPFSLVQFLLPFSTTMYAELDKCLPVCAKILHMKANEAKQSNSLNPVSFSSPHCLRIAMYPEFPSFLLIKT